LCTKILTLMKNKIIIIVILTLTITSLQSQNLVPVGNGLPPYFGIYGGTVTYNNEIYAATNTDIYKWDGLNWISLGVTTDDAILSMTVFNSELYVGGWFENFNGNPINRIIRYNGTIWQSVGTGILGDSNATGGVDNMIVYNGKLIALGGFIQAGNISAKGIASWDGAVWDSLGSGFTGLASIPTMSVLNNDLYVFSQISSAGGVPVNNAAKWNGTNWSALGNGITHWPVSSTVYNNNIYVGLNINFPDSSSVIVKWDGSNWTDAVQNYNHESRGVVMALTAFNGCLYATGFIDTINGVPVSNIARYDGNTWYAVPDGINGTGTYFTVLNNELYLTGKFSNSGATTVNNVVKFINVPLCTQDINEIMGSNDTLKVYPNPSSNNLTIKTSQKSTLEILNIQGQLLILQQIQQEKSDIDISRLAKGVYILRLYSSDKTEVTRFVKE